ncbi:unnamed protein product [Blepharisma stoltei]|uniref:Ion transport domain-containing protein n=1 Tax=Blepharisma stoltei TaxID=1481888 RepID=A0AAU9JJD1_9CILI|nr:unnamed protein product [Blepharisma stoltei]
METQKTEKPGGFMSWIFGDSQAKTVIRKSRRKKRLTKPQIKLNALMEEISTYIINNAENSISASNQVTSISLSSDDANVYFASNKGSVTCFNYEECKIVNDVNLHINSLNTLIIDHNLSRAVICGDSPILRVYTIPDFELEYEFKGHSANIAKIYLNDGLCYSGDTSGVIKRISIKSLKPDNLVISNLGNITDLVVSYDDYWLYISGDGCVIKVYNLNSKTEVAQLNHHSATVISLAIDPNSEYLASGGADNNVLLWKIPENALVKKLGQHAAPVRSLSFSPDGAFLATSSDDFSVKIWDLDQERREQTLSGHKGVVRSVIFSADRSNIFSCGDDTMFKVWKFPVFQEDYLYKASSSTDYNSVTFVPDTKSLLSCGTDKIVRRWDKCGNPTNEFITQGAGLKICVSQDEKYGAVGDELGILYLFNPFTFEIYHKIQAHRGLMRDLCFSPKSDYLVTGGGDSVVCIWKLEGTESIQLRGHNQSIWCICISHNGKRIYSGSSDKTVIEWDTENAVENGVIHAQEPVNSIAISQDDNLIITGGMVGIVKVWNIDEKWLESKFTVHAGVVTQILILRNNDTMLTAGTDAKIFVISLLYRETVSYFTHKSPIYSLVISSDENYLATGEKQHINFQENPLSSQVLSIAGPIEKIQEYFSYMRDILTDKHPTYENLHDSFLILPYYMNTLHIYSLLNLKEYIGRALSNSAAIIKTNQGFYPLSIALHKDFKGLRDEFVKCFCAVGKHNPFILQIVENELNKMNKQGFGALNDLYEVLYQETQRKSLPKFCETYVVFPITYISDTPRIKVSNFFDVNDISNQGTSMIFKECYIRLNFTMGSRQSLDFLQSLSRCKNNEVFKTPLVLDVVHYKWQTAQYPLMYQGFMYYSYLITLSVYTAYFMGNRYFQLTLFIMNTLLNVFELFLMAVSGKYYFTYVWNYVDWFRGCMLLLYEYMEWYYVYPELMPSVFAIVTFLSWARGIAYFRLFKTTRYFINLLISVLNGMSGYIILLFYSMASFCFIFIVLQRKMEIPDLMGNVRTSYNLVFGNFDFGNELIELTVCTLGIIINPIIMMTILISIITDVYEQVQSDCLSSDVKELIFLNIEVENLMFWRRRKTHKQYIQVAKEYEKEEDLSWEGKLTLLKKSLEKSHHSTMQFFGAFNKRIKDREELMSQNAKKTQKILELIKKEKENKDN